jgi:hypothetical protein
MMPFGLISPSHPMVTGFGISVEPLKKRQHSQRDLRQERKDLLIFG